MENEHLDQILKQLGTINQKLQEHDARFDQLDKLCKQTDNCFKQVDGQLNQLADGQQDLRQRINNIETVLENMSEKLNVLIKDCQVPEQTIQELNYTTERIEAKIDVLQLEATHNRRNHVRNRHCE